VAKAIKSTVLQKKMPPWFADPQFGKFSNDRALSQSDVNTLVAWVDAGAPLGDPKDMPAPKQFVEGWTIPKPDVVFQLPQPFPVPATGVMQYKYVIIPTGFTKDTWWSRCRPLRPTTASSITSWLTCAPRAPTTSRTCRRMSSSRRHRLRRTAPSAGGRRTERLAHRLRARSDS